MDETKPSNFWGTFRLIGAVILFIVFAVAAVIVGKDGGTEGDLTRPGQSGWSTTPSEQPEQPQQSPQAAQAPQTPQGQPNQSGQSSNFNF